MVAEKILIALEEKERWEKLVESLKEQLKEAKTNKDFPEIDRLETGLNKAKEQAVYYINLVREMKREMQPEGVGSMVDKMTR